MRNPRHPALAAAGRCLSRLTAGLVLVVLVAGCSWNAPRAARPGSVRGPATATGCERAAQRLRDRAGDAVEIILDPPFVIAGNLSRAQLETYRDQTVRAAARALWAGFVDTRPTRAIVILLFGDEATYRRYAQEWYGDDDVPYFGYYRARENTLLMNIDTGTGTLVHELTHALTAVDFLRMPDWFNEGFASLFEQCDIDDDTIRGQVNWRLPVLQRVIRAQRLRPLRRLLTSRNFRGRREALNYAHARYFCMFLQERGLLERFYRTFRDGARQDGTGVRFVEALFPDQTLEDVDAEFQAWVLSLGYPPAHPSAIGADG